MNLGLLVVEKYLLTKVKCGFFFFFFLLHNLMLAVLK